MIINVFSSSRYKLDSKRIVEIAERFFSNKDTAYKSVSIVFVGKRKMREVALKYKHEDVALPVLSFPFKEHDLLGEVFICFPQVVLLAAEKGKTLDAMLTYLIEHGLQNLLQS